MSLGPGSSDPTTHRPFQAGRVLGDENGVRVAENVEWLVDTGADIVAVWDRVGSRFDAVQAVGATASPTTGGGGMQVVTGIDAEFLVEDASGKMITRQVSGFVAVKSNNAASNVLGVAQLATAGARVEWDPSARSGSLRI